MKIKNKVEMALYAIFENRKVVAAKLLLDK